MVKGCLQLGLIPDINNTINLTPADHVALLASLSTQIIDPAQPFKIIHVTGNPRIRFNDLLGSLAVYGYPTQKVEYVQWRTKLEQHVLETQDNALFPLLHFVLDDLPTSTKAPEMDDTNARALARAGGEKEGAGVDEKLIGLYLAWLVRAGFLEAPSGQGEKTLPEIQGGAIAAIGRTTAGK
jgi:L-aminoadipate-semialdehyde dehydrogenase